jgi:hypothetical protein
MEEVEKEAAAAALREIYQEAAIAMLESVASEATKVAVRELCHGDATLEAVTWMYDVDGAAEEVRMVDVATVMAMWDLVDDGETEVKDSDDGSDDDEEEKMVEDGEERHPGEVALRTTQREAAACGAAKLVGRRRPSRTASH